MKHALHRLLALLLAFQFLLFVPATAPLLVQAASVRMEQALPNTVLSPTLPDLSDQPQDAILANAGSDVILQETEPEQTGQTQEPILPSEQGQSLPMEQTQTLLPEQAQTLPAEQTQTPLPEQTQNPPTEQIQNSPTEQVPAQNQPSSQTPNLSGPEISAPSALLMEASTGQILYEKNADTPRSPASITKIMTLILIFDALESGKIHMGDSVTTSAYAKSMGGSQVFLEEGEVQTVETLIKCIVIASGNDASVTMAEYIAGSEAEFVKMMNERAAGLGMTNTHFEDCCGLTDSLTHVTTARDIALMSRELITHYPQIENYSTIWMDTITHVTKQGTKEFGLSNTNKLLKMTTNFHVTGLKTGSTSLAKYCFSGTAEKDGIHLIASIMAAPDYKARFNDALTLLNYGFANCRMYQDAEMLPLPEIPVKNGKKDHVSLAYDGPFSYLSLKGEDFSAIEKDLILQEYAEAPVKAGDQAGWISYQLNGSKIGQVPVRFKEDIEKASFSDYWKQLAAIWLMAVETNP